jgi:hypothetical protein
LQLELKSNCAVNFDSELEKCFSTAGRPEMGSSFDLADEICANGGGKNLFIMKRTDDCIPSKISAVLLINCGGD